MQDDDEIEDLDNDEATEKLLTREQSEFVRSKASTIAHLIPAAIKEDEFTRLCGDFDFDEEKIDEYLKCLEIDEKYRGVEGF